MLEKAPKHKAKWLHHNRQKPQSSRTTCVILYTTRAALDCFGLFQTTVKHYRYFFCIRPALRAYLVHCRVHIGNDFRVDQQNFRSWYFGHFSGDAAQHMRASVGTDPRSTGRGGRHRRASSRQHATDRHLVVLELIPRDSQLACRRCRSVHG